MIRRVSRLIRHASCTFSGAADSCCLWPILAVLPSGARGAPVDVEQRLPASLRETLTTSAMCELLSSSLPAST